MQRQGKDHSTGSVTRSLPFSEVMIRGKQKKAPNHSRIGISVIPMHAGLELYVTAVTPKRNPQFTSGLSAHHKKILISKDHYYVLTAVT